MKRVEPAGVRAARLLLIGAALLAAGWTAAAAPLSSTLPAASASSIRLRRSVEFSAPLAAASVVVDARTIENQISPLLYGQFIEYMYEGIKGGLHAELLRNRSFEEAPNALGLSRYWERYPDDRNDDYGLSFRWDDTTAYPAAGRVEEGTIGGRSLLLNLKEGVIPRHGVYQSRIPVRRDVEYHGYLWLRTFDYEGTVIVSLEADVTGGETYAAVELGGVGRSDWKKYEFTLRPSKSDPLARFAILPSGRGQLWVDQVSLLPGDAVDGVRADVFEKIRALRPAFMRWPGGNVAQDYRWMWGIGPRDERTTWINLSWRNEPEPSDFGTDEYVRFARAVGAEPTITVNVEGRGATAAEAANWVEYCNGPATSKYGAMRAANGHREPFGVKYWEIGNEIWGDWVRGHSDAETYARNYNRYYEAMRTVDPTIKFIAVGDNNMEWNRTVLRGAGERIDFLAIHHYYHLSEMENDTRNLMARPLYYERFYRRMAQLMRTLVPQRKIRLAINEWGLNLPIARHNSIEAALYGARLMNVFERMGNLVALSAVSDLVNGWPGGIIQASRHGVFVTPTYLVNQLYNEHLGTKRLAAKIESPVFDTSREGQAVPYLDVVASRSADEKLIYLKAVNTDQMRPLSVSVSTQHAVIAPRAEMKTVAAHSLHDFNSFATPDAVSTTRSTIRAGRDFTIELPPHSVSVITLEVVK